MNQPTLDTQLAPMPESRLGEKRLTVPDAVAQSVGFMGPVFSVALLLPLIVGANAAGKGAGVTTPLAILVGALGTAGLAWIISRYAQRVSTCGALADYATRAIGEKLGFIAGWVYYGGALVFAVSTVMITAGTASDFLARAIRVDISWWVLALALSAVVFAIQFYGVRVATRAQLLLVGISAVAVLVFSIWVIIKSPGGLSLEPFNPGAAPGGIEGIFFGVIYGIALFIGFETSANLAEECAEPKRAIPRALLGAIIVGAAYYLIAAYAQALGFGLNASTWAKSGAPLFVLGADPAFGSTFISDALTVMVIVDATAVAIGTSIVASRGMFTLARDGRIPRALARTHPKHGTPVVAAVVLLALTSATVILTHVTDGLLSRATPDPKVLLPEYLPLWIWLATFGPFLFLLIYLVISVTALKGLRDDGHRAGIVAASVVGTLVAAGAIFGLVYQSVSPISLVPAYAAGWLLLGVGWLVYLMSRRRFRSAAPLAAGSHVEA